MLEANEWWFCEDFCQYNVSDYGNAFSVWYMNLVISNLC
jgi:hypothetical protein